MARPGKTLLFLGAIFLVIGSFLWYRYSYHTTLVPVQNTNYGNYLVTTQPGWIDTGVWIGPYHHVIAESSDIFILAVDSTSSEANLVGRTEFRARIVTTPYLVKYSDIAWVETQGKIYLYTDKPLTVKFGVFALSDDEKKKLDAEKSNAEQPSSPVKTFFVAFMLIFGIFAVLCVFSLLAKGSK